MMEKINIAELLKDCPRGMELECVIFNNVTLACVSDRGVIWIKCIDSNGNSKVIHLTPYGEIELQYIKSKCVIFPKGKTTWKGFHRPFVEGDIVSTESGIYIGIVKSTEDSHRCDTFCSINDEGDFFIDNNFLFSRFATEEEKQKLFDAIRVKGYEWNAETKTLVKLVEPKFKIGDRIKVKGTNAYVTIKAIKGDKYNTYYETVLCDIPVEEQDNWELVPNKFDINTLVPFEGKVLVRNDESQRWLPAFWGYKVEDGFITTFGWCKYCIPYKDNESLFKTNNDCDDFYKTWE